VESTVRDASEKSRVRFKDGIDQVIEGLRAKFDREDSKDLMVSIDSARNQNDDVRPDVEQIQLDAAKNIKQDPIYEQLGFKSTLKYGARSELR